MAIMRCIFIGLLVFSATIAFSNEKEELVINTFLEEVPTPLEVRENIIAEFRSGDQDPGSWEPSVLPVDPATIINIARQIWEVIKENRPVADIKFDYANALPRGKEAMDLQEWSSLQFKSYKLTGRNAWGSDVYDITFTAVHQYNGNLDGTGKYLETVTVLPQKVKVNWGYTVNVSVSRVTTSNVGTIKDPIANLIMEVTTKVTTVLQEKQERLLFEFRGDSASVRKVF